MQSFSNACERNQQPILDVLINWFRESRNILEIGSGTGQHAIWFSRHLPHLNWYTTDRIFDEQAFKDLCHNLTTARSEYALQNLHGPSELDVSKPWPSLPTPDQIDAIFTANSLHIMRDSDVQSLFTTAAQVLTSGLLCVYGPFNRNGEFTSPGNADLDQWVKSLYPGGGIKDLAEIQDWAQQAGFDFVLAQAMPANNLMLKFSINHKNPAQYNYI